MRSQHRQAIGRLSKENEGPLTERPERTPDAGDSFMRNDLKACNGPRLANTAPIGRDGSRRRRMVCGLLALTLVLALIAPGATAFAAEPTSGYSQTTPATPAPKQETAPTSTSSTPAKETTPAKSGTEPTKTSSEPTATTAKAKTLPFTGLDLRWITLGGVLLVAMGMSIVVVQRRSGARR
jgi:hypothetical protein